jgi:hypothetical protein
MRIAEPEISRASRVDNQSIGGPTGCIISFRSDLNSAMRRLL